QHVRLLDLALWVGQAPVVVVDRHRQGALGLLLLDHVLVEHALDLARDRRGQGPVAARRRGDDAVAHPPSAVGAKERAAGGGDEVDGDLGPAADGAACQVASARRHQPLNLRSDRGSTMRSMSPYSSACWGDMNLSRSMSRRSFSRGWPVWRS